MGIKWHMFIIFFNIRSSTHYILIVDTWRRKEAPECERQPLLVQWNPLNVIPDTGIIRLM